MNDENPVCSLRVIVTGDDLEPESVTSTLALTPSIVWRCGEPVLPDSRHKHSTSGWNFSRNLSEDEISKTLIWIADIIHNSNICRADNDFNVEVMIVFFGLPQHHVMIPVEAIGVLSKKLYHHNHHRFRVKCPFSLHLEVTTEKQRQGMNLEFRQLLR